MSESRSWLALPAGLVALAAAAPLALLGAPFWAVAALTRVLADRLQPSAAAWDEVIRFDPHFGWVPVADLAVHALDLNGDAFQVTTDSEGFRGPATLDEADMIVLGDSFAFGYGVDDRDFFAARAPAAAGGPRVKGVGAPGYNMVQSLFWLERLAPRLAGKTVVWLVYVGNDLDDNLRPEILGYPAPFLRTPRPDGRRADSVSLDGRDSGPPSMEQAEPRPAWEIVAGHIRQEPWQFQVRGFSYETLVDVCRPTELSRRAFDAAAWLIARARAVCDAAGARLVIATVPDLAPVQRRMTARVLERTPGADAFDPALPERAIARACDAAGAEYVSMGEHLSAAHYREYDVHWNEEGHRQVGAVLRRIQSEALPGRREDGTTATRAESVAGGGRP